jgi:L-alanine-DL-glutamate epimerase-like enolase superfamily enzyme
MVDLNQAWRMPGDTTEPATVDDVLRLVGPLADLGVVWLEEPRPLDDSVGLRRIRDVAGEMRIAGGEYLLATTESWQLLADGALDVHQQDVQLTLGLHEGARFARAVIDAGHWFTPHTWGDAFSLLVNLHLTCGVGGGPWLEYPHDPPGWRAQVRDVVLKTPTVPDDEGWLRLPAGPGLGADLDLDVIDDLTVAETRLT